jgi:apolipoprotein D and lipocalin family protein
MGTWYEIAKFPNWFQRKCASHTKASYALKADGDVEVINPIFLRYPVNRC